MMSEYLEGHTAEWKHLKVGVMLLLGVKTYEGVKEVLGVVLHKSQDSMDVTYVLARKPDSEEVRLWSIRLAMLHAAQRGENPHLEYIRYAHKEKHRLRWELIAKHLIACHQNQQFFKGVMNNNPYSECLENDDETV